MTPDDALRRILDASFVIRVSHVGRKSGRPRVLETTYYWDRGNKIYLSGYPGRRDWVANMSANPTLTLSGRNVFRWVNSDWWVLDPEIGCNTGHDCLVVSQQEHLPPPHVWTASLRFGL